MSGKIILLIMKTILRIVKTILRIVGLGTGFPARAQEKMFVGRAVNLAGKWPTKFRTRQDKTNPSLVTGLRCKLYTRNPFDYRRLCELVLG